MLLFHWDSNRVDLWDSITCRHVPLRHGPCCTFTCLLLIPLPNLPHVPTHFSTSLTCLVVLGVVRVSHTFCHVYSLPGGQAVPTLCILLAHHQSYCGWACCSNTILTYRRWWRESCSVRQWWWTPRPPVGGRNGTTMEQRRCHCT